MLDRIVAINKTAVDADANFAALLPPEALQVTLEVMVSAHDEALDEALDEEALPVDQLAAGQVAGQAVAQSAEGEEEPSSFDRVEVYSNPRRPNLSDGSDAAAAVTVGVDGAAAAAGAAVPSLLVSSHEEVEGAVVMAFEAVLTRGEGEDLGLGIGFDDERVLLLTIGADSPAERCGALLPFDEIRAINGQPVNVHSDFARVLSVAGRRIVLRCVRFEGEGETEGAEGGMQTSPPPLPEEIAEDASATSQPPAGGPSSSRHMLRLERTAGQDLGLGLGFDVEKQCIVITSITPGSIAEQSGQLRVLDPILSINGEAVSDSSDFAALLSSDTVTSVDLEIVISEEEEDEEGEEDAEAAPLPPIPIPKLALSTTGRVPSSAPFEIVLSRASPSESFGMGIDPSSSSTSGAMVISSIEKGSPAEACGLLREGDLVTSINGVEVNVESDFSALLPADATSMVLVLSRDGEHAEPLLEPPSKQRGPPEQRGPPVPVINVASVPPSVAAEAVPPLKVRGQPSSTDLVLSDEETDDILHVAVTRVVGDHLGIVAGFNADAELEVASVEAGSPAANSGLRSGDCIVAVNGKRLEEGSMLSDVLPSSATRLDLTLKRTAVAPGPPSFGAQPPTPISAETGSRGAEGGDEEVVAAAAAAREAAAVASHVMTSAVARATAAAEAAVQAKAEAAAACMSATPSSSSRAFRWIEIQRQTEEEFGLGITVADDGAATVSEIDPGTPAAAAVAAGLLAVGDVLEYINGRQVTADVEYSELLPPSATRLSLGLAAVGIGSGSAGASPMPRMPPAPDTATLTSEMMIKQREMALKDKERELADKERELNIKLAEKEAQRMRSQVGAPVVASNGEVQTSMAVNGGGASGAAARAATNSPASSPAKSPPKLPSMAASVAKEVASAAATASSAAAAAAAKAASISAAFERSDFGASYHPSEAEGHAAPPQAPALPSGSTRPPRHIVPSSNPDLVPPAPLSQQRMQANSFKHGGPAIGGGRSPPKSASPVVLSPPSMNSPSPRLSPSGIAGGGAPTSTAFQPPRKLSPAVRSSSEAATAAATASRAARESAAAASQPTGGLHMSRFDAESASALQGASDAYASRAVGVTTPSSHPCRLAIDTAGVATAVQSPPDLSSMGGAARASLAPHRVSCHGSFPEAASIRSHATPRSTPRLSSPVACGQAVHTLATLPAGGLLSGRGDGVTGMSGGDSSLVLAAGRDKAIRAYSPSGALCLQHSAHIDRIWSVVATGSDTIASASSDRSVRLWKVQHASNARTPRLGSGGAAVPLELSKQATLSGHTDAVQALLMHRGRLVSGSADCSVRLWDLDTRSLVLGMTMPIAMPQREMSAIHALAHSPDPTTGRAAETLWSGHWRGSINLWDAAAGSLLRNLSKAHDGCVWSLQPLPYAPELMASTGADGMVRLWDARQAGLVGALTAGNPTYCLASSGGPNALLVSAGHDGHLRLWDVRRMLALTTLHLHRAPVRSLLVLGGSVWSGSTDGTVRSWEISQLLGAQPSPLSHQAQVFEDFLASGAQPRMN